MAKKKYRAVNQIVGLVEKPLQIDDVVTLDDAVAAPFVATGSLAPYDERAAKADAPAGEVKG